MKKSSEIGLYNNKGGDIQMGEEKMQEREDGKEQVLKQVMVQADEEKYLQRKIQTQNKLIKQIETSNTWKAAKPIRLIDRIKKLISRNNKAEQKQLEKELRDTALQLSETKAKLEELQLQDEELNTLTIQQLMRTAKDEATLIQQIDKLVAKKNDIQANYQDALTYIGRLYMNEDDIYRNTIYQKLMEGLSTEEIPEFMIRAGLTEEPIPLQNVASFRSALHMRMRRLQLRKSLPEWILDDKIKAYEFVEELAIRTPKVDASTYSLKEIPQREGIVIKPSDGAGGRGVYLVHRLDYIYDVKNSQVLKSFEDLMTNMQKDLNDGAVAEDDWMIEEIIYENKEDLTPARDLKFYMFYGKLGLVLEIVRDPEVRHCWWNGDGERVLTGKYEESLFHGKGIRPEEIRMVESLSEEIPAPFLRIDFLTSETGIVFGEFTPKPGDYDDFDEETDRLLGDYYLDAQARLEADLLQGKQFNAFKRLAESESVTLTE